MEFKFQLYIKIAKEYSASLEGESISVPVHADLIMIHYVHIKEGWVKCESLRWYNY